MNRLFQHLTQRPADEAPLTEEELDAQDAEAKKARIQFHRDRVRNGPARFSYWTTGQMRRQQDRDTQRRSRKATKRHRQQWKDQQAKIATLRGHLTILGVIECRHEGISFTETQIARSAEWVYLNFAERDDEGVLVTASEEAMGKAVVNARDAFLEAIGADKVDA